RPWFKSAGTYPASAVATDLGGKVLVVGRSSEPTSLYALAAAVRFRVAPLAELGSAPDVVLLGADVHNGSGWAYLQAFPRGDAAVVCVGSHDHEFTLVRVAASGAFEPVHVESGL
ncbi:MAG TPA: hypothetical protein VIY73_16995, partial [Polyangiaceae bacterium]